MWASCWYLFKLLTPLWGPDQIPPLVQSLICVWLFATPWTAGCQASLFSINSWSLLKLMSVESVMLSNHLSVCHLLLLLLSIFPSIRVFSNESVLHIRWPNYWRFSFSISPSNEYSGLISLGLTGLISLLSKGLSRIFSNTVIRNHQFIGSHPSLTHSSVLAWRILGTEEAGGSHRVRHDWSNLAAAVAPFFMVQLSHPHMATGKALSLTIQIFVGKKCLCLLIHHLGLS